MYNRQQGLWFTKSKTSAHKPEEEWHPIKKKQYIFIDMYKPRHTIFTNKIVHFPQCFSHGSNNQMVATDIESNSTLVKTTIAKISEEKIAVHHQILARMKIQDIVPTHQVIDNEISEAYKNDILLTDMT